MSVKRKIIRGLIVVFWLLVTVCVCTLLVAGIKSKNTRLCSKIDLRIIGPADGLFLDKKEILRLMNSINGPIEHTPLQHINLNSLEDILRKQPWISKAELYFTNQGVLDVEVVEREPIARIFTIGGSSFYIDSQLVRLPLHPNYVARKPVFTGFPSDAPLLKPADSALLRDILNMSKYIYSNPFWMAQVEQIDISADRQFTMVPKVGNQLVFLGDGKNADAKFKKLMIFYKDILRTASWNRYVTIHVGYKGQIVATKRDGQAVYSDTTAARRNMEDMFKKQQLQAMKDTTGDRNVTR
ncbi:MAG: cell division protein FtsQ/DivIB, partial [Sphingobacteriales bacterium]